MIKTVLSGSFDFNDAVAALVPMHRRGVDAGWPEKRASSPLFDFDKIQPQANETLVHLLALGDGECVGCNRNGDFFSKDANKKHFQTFKTAHFFRHHDNDDPRKAYGRVVEAAHNDAMGRVELVVGLDNDKCAEDLGIIEKNGFFDCSMSARVPFDVCSVCGNKARSRSEYCKHASMLLGRILGDGRQVYVDNPDPTFFDISRVWRGADRVARTFRTLGKAAANGNVVGGAELAEQLGIADANVVKSAFRIQNEATAEAFAAFLEAWPWGSCNALRPTTLTDKQHDFLKIAGSAADAAGALADRGVLLSPASFFRLFGQLVPLGVTDDAVKQAARATLSDPVRVKTACENGAYDGGRQLYLADSLFGNMTPSSAIEDLSKTVQDIACGNAPHEKRAAAPAASSDVEALGDAYAAYVIAAGRRAAAAFPGREVMVRNLTAVRGFS